jgi:hypothetical protein
MPGITGFKLHPKREGDSELIRNNLLGEIKGRRYKLLYTVFTDDSRIGPVQLMTDPTMPYKFGDPYTVNTGESDPLATCVNIQPIPTENRKVWHVVYTFSTERLVALNTENPLNQPPEVDWDVEQDERAETQDAFGVNYSTSAGHPYDPPVMRRYGKSILRVTRNEAAYNESFARTFWNKINIGTFAAYPQGYARVNHITARKGIANGQVYYQVNYEIAFNSYSWFTYLLDQDWRDGNGDGFHDGKGQPMANASLLNGRGFHIDTAVANLKANITDAQTTLALAAYRDGVKFPPPRNPVETHPTLAGTFRRGPHNSFYIIVEDMTDQWLRDAQQIYEQKALRFGKKPNGKADPLNPKVVATPAFEIMLVTGVKTEPNADPAPENYTTTFTVVRGQKGTTPRAFTVGTPITIRLLPYYRYFIDYEFADFTKLNLPII